MISIKQQPLIRKPLDPFSKLSINHLATNKEFQHKYKITQKINQTNTHTTVLIKNLCNSGYSIAKIYNCYDKHSKKVNKKQLNRYWTEYHTVKYSGLMEYFDIFYDHNTCQLIIHQQAYQQTLKSFIHKNGPIRAEKQVKIIMNGILKKLWRLHDYNFVHCNIKPSNIMERKLDHLYQTEFINDGWLLIDFNSMHKNKSKSSYIGAMGWTAPEINYDSKKNIYNFSSDIFSFGLIILYIMFGYQPLEIIKYNINKYGNKIDINDNDICRKWYNEVVIKSENIIKNYLVKLYYNNKISLELFELLHDGILVYDSKKRLNCKQIYYSKWLADINCNK